MCLSLCGVKEKNILASFAEAAPNICFDFVFSPPPSVLTVSGENFARIFLITSFLLSSSLQFLRLLLLHSWAHQCRAQVNQFCGALCPGLDTALSTFPIMFVLAHDGKNGRITLICTFSDTRFCVM